jgi:hypothetical protein
VKRYPQRLEDLLQDQRFLNAQRYLRRVYRDPMTGTTEWGLVQAPEGGIAGVYSLSEARSISMLGPRPVAAITRNATYRDWRFVYEPPAR